MAQLHRVDGTCTVVEVDLLGLSELSSQHAVQDALHFLVRGYLIALDIEVELLDIGELLRLRFVMMVEVALKFGADIPENLFLVCVYLCDPRSYTLAAVVIVDPF